MANIVATKFEEMALHTLDSNDGRLPSNVKPLNYDVTFNLDLEELTFSGIVVIDLIVLQDTDSITLHSLDLQLPNVSLKLKNQTPIKPQSIKTNESEETVTFGFSKTLPAKSSALLTIDFEGVLGERTNGLYRAKYVGRDNKVKYGAATQFQATEARKALPCFDEPALKATFDVTIVADSSLVALSNMDVKSTSYHTPAFCKEKQTVKFNTTPIMSSYLLALTVAELNFAESNDFRIPIRVYTTSDKPVQQCQYAADLTANFFKFFEEKFQIEYPLPKIDLVGLADKQGAMENYGLILYQETAVLFDDAKTSSRGKAQVASVVAHEEGHQWFGDLVTMSWWEGLWLNESFATWSSDLALNALYPEWQIWTGFASSTLQQALTTDSLHASHPIEVKVKTSADIAQVFDNISYQKGGSVLRMLSVYLGEEVFLKGVAQYLKAHAFSNTKTNDLWKALSDVSGKDITAMMSVWTLNIGHPILTVTESNGVAHVKQNRYLRSGYVKPEEDKTIWPVFLAPLTKDGVDNQLLLSSREASFKLPTDDFYKLNSGHTGVYRVLYPESRYRKFIISIESGALTPVDRAGLLFDAISLTQSGHLSLPVTFDLALALSTDSSYFVWQALTAWFTALKTAWMFHDHGLFGARITSAQRHIFATQAHKLGVAPSAPNDVIDAQFKANLFATAGLAGDRSSIDFARKAFKKFFAGDRDAIPVDLRAAVFQLVIHADTSDVDYDSVLHEYEHGATTAEERTTALSALGYARRPSLLSRTIALVLDKTRVPNTMLSALVSGLNTHSAGITALFDVLLNHLDQLKGRYGGGLGGLGNALRLFCGGLATHEQADRLEAFFADKETEGFERTLRQVVEEVRIRAEWVRRDGEALGEWLDGNGDMC